MACGTYPTTTTTPAPGMDPNPSKEQQQARDGTLVVLCAAPDHAQTTHRGKGRKGKDCYLPSSGKRWGGLKESASRIDEARKSTPSVHRERRMP
ncbi:hypothetical protein ZWY2020_017997 [Hordeum vulgare]|nr:hypothetical protein ZWY2020_017997 [Hordeum vulgare]